MKGDGCVFRRGNVWWMQFYRDGKQIQMSCGRTCKNEETAKSKLRLELRKSDEEFIEPRTKRTTIGDLMKNLFLHYEANGQDDYRKMALAKWQTYMMANWSLVRAHAFGTEHMNRYRTMRMAAGAAVATINRELQILHRAFSLGAEQEPPMVKRVPRFKLTKEDNARQGFVTTPQLEALRTAAGKEGLEYRLAVELAHWLGWRKGEIFNLRVRDISLADNAIRAEKTKSGRKREVPMSKSLRVLIQPFVVGREPDEPLFKTVRYDFRKQWARITQAAGCPDLLFHDLRRTSARSKRAAGVAEGVIMDMQGWETNAVFRRYAIVDQDDKVAAIQRQEEYERAALAIHNSSTANGPESKNDSEVAHAKRMADS